LNCVTVPNFVEIGQIAAETLRFLRFLNMTAAAVLDF